MSTGARRHQRQRSSVTIKKRGSLNKLNDGESVPDNALSAASVEPNGNASVAAAGSGPSTQNGNSQRDGHTPSFNPQHGNHLSPVEADEDRMNISQPRQLQTQEQDYFSLGAARLSQQQDSTPAQDLSTIHNGSPSPAENNNLPTLAIDTELAGSALTGMQADDMTTRTELDLIDDEDTSTEADASCQRPIAGTVAEAEDEPTVPPLPPKGDGVQKPLQDAHSLKDRVPAPITPKMIQGESGTFATPTSSGRGTRGLSLLSGGVLSSPSSPSTSPSAIRMAKGPTAPGNTTPRSGRRAHRMSLGYFAASDARSAQGPNGFFGTGQPMMSPVMSTSAASSASRFTPTTPRSASVSTTASMDSDTPGSAKRLSEDGETILTQHKGILERIAEKERGILELKENLAREEADLKLLQKEWQRSAARELANNKAHSSRSSGELAANEEKLAKEKESRTSIDSAQGTASGAADTFKGFSAKLQSGLGNQLNAFLDQLVATSPSEELQPTSQEMLEQDRASAASGAGLGALIEEDEGESRETKSTTAPAELTTKRAQPTVSQSNGKHNKRTSMFGASFAAFQKQMEQQFGATMSAKTNEDQMGAKPDLVEKAPQWSDFSWGTVQKRLKEARENASGLLAMAEAKIGQAMTMDDLVQVDEHDAKPKRSAPPSVMTCAFTEENDREKAALAELSWLNSLAGVKTSGSVDRVTATVDGPQSGSMERLSQQNLLELEDVRRIARAVSPASSSQSTTRPDKSPVSRVQSPPLGSSGKQNTSSRSSKRNSTPKEPERRPTGFFEVLNAVWASDKSPSPTTSDRRSPSPGARSPRLTKEKRLSGQSKTRLAARAAVQQGKSPSLTVQSTPKLTASTEKAWQWDDLLSEEEQTSGASTIGIDTSGLDDRMRLLKQTDSYLGNSESANRAGAGLYEGGPSNGQDQNSELSHTASGKAQKSVADNGDDSSWSW